MHHFVIKWRRHVFSNGYTSRTKQSLYFSFTFFLVMTIANCDHSLVKRGGNLDNFIKRSNHSIYITSNSSTLLDCSTWKDCSWTWDKDNFTKSIDEIDFSRKVDFPGQHGFYTTNAKFIRSMKNRMGDSTKTFYGPRKNKSGKSKVL